MGELTLDNGCCTARLVPGQGGRVASLIDRASGRELLYQRTPAPGPRVDYLASSAGGWEEMFPNDSPHDGYPFHGVLWDTPFALEQADGAEATLRARVARPAVDVEYRFALLSPPQRGLALTIDLTARAATGPLLWTSHPMLAVEPGWVIEADGPIEVDAEMPGRFTAGPVGPGERATALAVPATSRSLGEVLYLPATGSASVRSASGERGTRVVWGHDVLRWLWIVTIAKDLGIDLALLLEPSTSVPYRLDEAILRGESLDLPDGGHLRLSVLVESLDEVS